MKPNFHGTLRSWFRFAVLWLIAAARTCAAADPRPNIVFILADDLGYTDLGCQGSRYYETPNIDRLAREGMRFTSGYTCGPNCQPTRAALISGQYGSRTGVYTVGGIDRFDWRRRPLRPVDNVEALPLDRITIAQALRDGGYATGMFGKWHLGSDAAHHPARRGFDEAIVSEGRHFGFVTDPPLKHPEDEYLADFLTDRAVDFIERHRSSPFFLYLPHFGVHVPQEAKTNLVRRFANKAPSGGHRSAVYAAMISSLDESVGRVLATLERLGLSANTLVLFSSDNGGVGGYIREGIGGPDNTDNAPLRSGKGSLHEGGIRVPYVFRWPGRIAPGATSDQPIITVDLYPTFLAVAGIKPPPGQVLDGTSFLPQLLGGGHADPTRAPLFWHFPGYLGQGKDHWRTLPVGVIREGDWKLMEFFEDGRLELYNLREDLSEQRDLSQSQPELVRQLQAKLAAWRANVKAPMPTPHVPER